jgi:hypothetical protein
MELESIPPATRRSASMHGGKEADRCSHTAQQDANMATIKDVARHAGVGVGTASRVVSGKGPVAPATLERVQQAIAALD